MALPVDLPRPNGQTFVIYSRLQRDGSGALIVPSAPYVGQSIAVDSITGIASASGGLNNANLSISPVVSGGALTWNVQGKAQCAYGVYSFSCTIATNGDSGVMEAGQVSFTFRVLLLGKAHLYAPVVRYFRVGEKLEGTSIVPQTVNPLIDYGASVDGALRHGTEGAVETYTDSGITRTRWVGYASGFVVQHVKDQTGRTTDIRLYGAAERPGVYVVWVSAAQWGEGGQYSTLVNPFPPGNGSVPVIVSIYDTELPDGTLGVRVNALYDPAPVRTVVHYERADAPASAAHLYDVTFTPGTTEWTAEYTEDPQGQTPVYFEYQILLDGSAWKLNGRTYAQGETPPAWDTLDSAANPSGATLPPVHGWSYSVFRANPAFYLDSDTPAKVGFYAEIGEDMYQQTPVYTPQYEGITMPPKFRNNGGYIINGDEPGRMAIPGAVIPYAPPVIEFVGSTPVRDVALDIGSTLLNISSDTDLRINGYGIFPFWHDHRRFVPGNGSTGDMSLATTVPFRFAQEHWTERYSEGETYTPEAYRVTDYNMSRLRTSTGYALEKTVSLGALQSRSGAELMALLYADDALPSVEIDRGEEEEDLLRIYGPDGVTYDTKHGYTISETPDTAGTSAGYSLLNLYPASGIRYVAGSAYATPRHATFTIAGGQFSANCDTVKTTREYWQQDEDEPTIEEHSEASNWGGAGAFFPNCAAVVSGDTLSADAQWYSGEQTYSRQSNAPSITYEDPDTGEEITTVARSWEYRLTWTGSYMQAGGSGTLREVHYEDGALVSDTTVDDPRAELFAQRRAYIQALPHAPGLTWNDLIIRGENAQTYSLG